MKLPQLDRFAWWLVALLGATMATVGAAFITPPNALLILCGLFLCIVGTLHYLPE